MDYEYFRVEESEQFSFFRIPKALFTEKEFEGLSTDAKLLYGILLDRINLSKKNGWVDADGYVYIIYTVAELQEVLHMSHTTVTKLLRELDSIHGIGLIERYRQGCNRPSVIYVKNFVKRIRAKPAVYYPSGTQEICCPESKKMEVRSARILPQIILIKIRLIRMILTGVRAALRKRKAPVCTDGLEMSGFPWKKTGSCGNCIRMTSRG